MEKQPSPGHVLTEREQQLLREFRLENDLVIRVRSGSPVKPKVIGGYQSVKTCGSFGERFTIRLHRLKFLLAFGYLPKEVDHRDVDGSNSVLSNLRAATRSQNACNRKQQANSLQYRGVRKHGRKWIATLTFEGMTLRLGSYDSPEKASAVVEAIAEGLHGDFYRSPEDRQCP